jgi:hypothetical protein
MHVKRQPPRNTLIGEYFSIQSNHRQLNFLGSSLSAVSPTRALTNYLSSSVVRQ